MIRKFFNYIGFFVKPEPLTTQQREKQEADEKLRYKTPNKGAIKYHLEFMRSLEAWETNRLDIIEGKNSQLFAQTSIIFSLLGLFVPVLVDKTDDMLLSFKIAIIVFLILAFLFYMIAIYNSLKNYNVKKFNYSQPDYKDVMKLSALSDNGFIENWIRDLIFCLPRIRKVNNIKASNLIYSRNAFNIGNAFTIGLVGIFSVSYLFFPISTEKEYDMSVHRNEFHIDHITMPTKEILDSFVTKSDTNNIKDRKHP